jgi:hypothetical protein
MEENGMIRAPYPPYSSDLAHSDFYLFGYMRHCLRGQSFEAADELFSAVEAVLGGLEKRLWMGFFSNGWRDSGDAL